MKHMMDYTMSELKNLNEIANNMRESGNITEGSREITEALGGDPGWKTMDEFDALMMSGDTITL